MENGRFEDRRRLLIEDGGYWTFAVHKTLEIKRIIT